MACVSVKSSCKNPGELRFSINVSSAAFCCFHSNSFRLIRGEMSGKERH